MQQPKRPIRALRPKTYKPYTKTLAYNILQHGRHYPSTPEACVRCSGLFIHERVISTHFSGFATKCVNCGATEYIPVSQW